MRHITDGELHAYLDGSLDHLTGERGEEIRLHLDVCPTCRERLQDEEEIRDQAEALLERSAPVDMPLPSFEELRARAEAPERPKPGESKPARHRGPLRGVPLAWAATIILALGVGWMGGQVWRSTPRGQLVPTGPRSPAFRSSFARDSLAEGETGGVAADEEEPEADALTGVLPEAVDESRVGGVQVPEEASGRGEGQPVSASAGAVAPELESLRKPIEALELRQKSSVEDMPTAEARRDAGIPEAALLAPPAPLADQAAAPTMMPGGPEDVGDSSMLVPGLEVVTVTWEEWAPGERALHIRQLLPTGDTLELRYLGLLMGSDPDAVPVSMSGGRIPEEEGMERPLSPKVLEASLPPGWNQVVMRWGRGWLVARAPLPVESLRGILRSLR